MERQIAIVWATLLLCALNTVSAAELRFKGVVITTGDKVVVTPEFVFGRSLEGGSIKQVKLLSSGQVVDIPLAKIRRIIFAPKPSRVAHSKKWGHNCGGPDDAIIFLRDNRRFEVSGIYFDKALSCEGQRRGISFKISDPISGGMKVQGLAYWEIREIRFDEDYGVLRKDGQGRLFPPDYVFSPYTGEEMELVPVN